MIVMGAGAVKFRFFASRHYAFFYQLGFLVFASAALLFAYIMLYGIEVPIKPPL
ncbi:MAG: hypothetical protein HY930_00010 [Euryarchaeota archaeon]|nr:hypothetical protein [Euryarchaeota archaeon]